MAELTVHGSCRIHFLNTILGESFSLNTPKPILNQYNPPFLGTAHYLSVRRGGGGGGGGGGAG